MGQKRAEEGMENSISMNGGEGPNSYFRNSQTQAKIMLRSSIEDSLEIQKDRQTFTIADLGCSVGPNTFSCVKNIIEAVEHKYSNTTHNGLELKVPELQVFFNDHVSNDFNTLFKAFPSDRQYMAAGVPGSFHARLFPKSSMNIMHSAYALNWLSRVPEEVTKEDSPLWNKGRITYVMSSSEVMDAFREQFFRDMACFFTARLAELVPGGLLAILLTCRQEGTPPSESLTLRSFECLGDALSDMVKEGLLSEGLVDSFNLPIFFPTVSEVNQVVSSIKHLRTEKFEKFYSQPKLGTPEGVKYSRIHIRAVLEGILCKHFGSDVTDELFERYPEKLEKFSKTPHFARVEKLEHLFLLVKRNDASSRYSCVL